MPTAQKRAATNQLNRKPVIPTLIPVNRPLYRRGQLINNGSFEDTPPFKGWNYAGVDLVTTPEYAVHSGLAAARLGEVEPQAQLVQLVDGIVPGRYYQFSLYVMAVYNSENAPLTISVEYLNRNKQLIGKPALQIKIAEFSLSDEVYSSFLEYTRYPAPVKVRYARITIATNTTSYPQGAILIDDVTMAGVL